MKRIIFVLLTGYGATVLAAEQGVDAILAVAKQWRDRGYRIGQSEQCMNWTREVLMQACSARFATWLDQDVWDAPYLPAGTIIQPEDADSLASNRFGQKILSIRELREGDLVFLKNTYGDWADGVITHVGIASGNGRYIHRMTSNKGFVREEIIPKNDFAMAVRFHPGICRP